MVRPQLTGVPERLINMEDSVGKRRKGSNDVGWLDVQRT